MEQMTAAPMLTMLKNDNVHSGAMATLLHRPDVEALCRAASFRMHAPHGYGHSTRATATADGHQAW